MVTDLSNAKSDFECLPPECISTLSSQRSLWIFDSLETSALQRLPRLGYAFGERGLSASGSPSVLHFWPTIFAEMPNMQVGAA